MTVESQALLLRFDALPQCEKDVVAAEIHRRSHKLNGAAKSLPAEKANDCGQTDLVGSDANERCASVEQRLADFDQWLSLFEDRQPNPELDVSRDSIYE